MWWKTVLCCLTVLTMPVAMAQHDHSHQDLTDYRTTSLAGWLDDLDQIDTAVRERHPLGEDMAFLARWESAVSESRAALAYADTAERLAILHRLVADIGDGHTNLVPFYLGAPGFDERFPFRAYQFADGFYLTAITRTYAGLLGARIDAINGVPVEAVADRFYPLIGADNRQWQRNWAAYVLSFPAYLDMTGATGETVTLALTSADGGAHEVTLSPTGTPDLEVLPAPVRPDTGTEPFGLARINGGRVLFIRFEAVADGEAESLAQFADRVAEALADPQTERVIIDIRENGGGNNELSAPLVRALFASRQNRPGGIYVLTGRVSFSAAMNFASQMERFTWARFVGEPTGGAPNHFGDPEIVMLESTGLPLLLSTLRWQDSHPADARGAIDPDILVAETIADRRMRRDAALEAAMAEAAPVGMLDPIRRWTRGCQVDCE